MKRIIMIVVLLCLAGCGAQTTPSPDTVQEVCPAGHIDDPVVGCFNPVPYTASLQTCLDEWDVAYASYEASYAAFDAMETLNLEEAIMHYNIMSERYDSMAVAFDECAITTYDQFPEIYSAIDPSLSGTFAAQDVYLDEEAYFLDGLYEEILDFAAEEGVDWE